MTRFPVHISLSEPETRLPCPSFRVPRALFLVPCSSLLPPTPSPQICLAPALVAFSLVLGEAEAGSAGKQPAEEYPSLASKRGCGGGCVTETSLLVPTAPTCFTAHAMFCLSGSNSKVLAKDSAAAVTA